MSSLSYEGIERYFNALIDASDAIQLRKIAVSVDIAECLKILDSKLSMYCKDAVFLSSAAYEIQLIEEESLMRNLGINFYGLEMCRSLSQDPPYGLSFMENHSDINSSITLTLQTQPDLHRATRQFIEDPFSLTEHRLPLFNSMQR